MRESGGGEGGGLPKWFVLRVSSNDINLIR